MAPDLFKASGARLRLWRASFVLSGQLAACGRCQFWIHQLDIKGNEMKISKIISKKIAVIAIAAAGALAAGPAGAINVFAILDIQNNLNVCVRVYTDRNHYQDIMPGQTGSIKNAPQGHQYTISFFSGRCGGKAFKTRKITVTARTGRQAVDLIPILNS